MGTPRPPRGHALLLALLGASCASASGFPLFGPGPHWIDQVTAGTVRFGAEAAVGLDLDFDGAADASVDVEGTATIARGAARSTDPTDPAGHHSHLDLEVVTATLSASTSPVGPVTLRFGDGAGDFAVTGPLASLGRSDEVPGSPALAQDDFAIFFEVEAIGLRFHNVAPLRMRVVIDQLPPIGSRFIGTELPLPLLDETGRPFLQVVAVDFTPTPLPSHSCDPLGRDAADLAGARTAVAATCDCLRAATHRGYLRCAKGVAAARARDGLLDPGCRATAEHCAARSTCGRPGFVTCCRTNALGVSRCAIKHDASRCLAPRGGQACSHQAASCCDACGSTCRKP